jgi:TctA family transporter
MSGSFQRPSSLSLCIFSGLWLIAALWFGVSYALSGKIVAALIMGLFGFAALGLWYQSRLAAWTLIVFACAGILFALLKIGHAPVLRIVTPIAWAIWAITLLVEFLRGETSS